MKVNPTSGPHLYRHEEDLRGLFLSKRTRKVEDLDVRKRERKKEVETPVVVP